MSFNSSKTDAKGYKRPVQEQQAEEIAAVPRRNDVVVSETKQEWTPFSEPDHFHLDEFEYPRNGTDPGKIIVFNHEYYDVKRDIPVRRGSRRDVNEIITCFQRLGFNIYDDDVLTDLTVKEIQQKIDSVLKNTDELSKTNCLIIFFLSHGDQNGELHAFDGLLTCSEIWTKFNDCKELNGKPKMFIFQACKGLLHTTTDGYDNVFNPPELLDFKNFTFSRLGTDMLLLYSTLEGNVSFRHPVAGTWFIQELCKNFSSYGRRDDVISLITRTIKCVSSNYFNVSEDRGECQKQMPIFVSTLSRKFYLNRNKDRHLLLENNRKLDEIYQLVKELANQLRE